MKFIAGALVVLAGSILWGAAVCAVSLVYMAGGNRGAADLASYGGMAVVAIGCLILFRAHTDTTDVRAS
jgi:hypothetical protein